MSVCDGVCSVAWNPSELEWGGVNWRECVLFNICLGIAICVYFYKDISIYQYINIRNERIVEGIINQLKQWG